MPRAFYAKDIAEHLRKIGIAVEGVGISFEPELEDDSVQLAPGWHVQVGDTYLILVETSGEGDVVAFPFRFGPEHTTLPDLVGEILEKVPSR